MRLNEGLGGPVLLASRLGQVAFPIVFLIVHFLVLWGGAKLLGLPTAQAWQMFGDHGNMATVIVIIAPIIGLFIGGVAGGAVAMQDRLTGQRSPLYFFGGFFLACWCTYGICIWGGFNLLVGSYLAKEIFTTLGGPKFALLTLASIALAELASVMVVLILSPRE